MICRASVSRENVSLMVPPCLPVPWNRAALLSCGLFRLAGAGLLPFLFLGSLDEVGEAFLLLQQEVLAHSAGLGQRQNDLILVFMQVIAGNHPGSQHHPRVAQQRSAQQSAPGGKTGGSQHCTMSDGISSGWAGRITCAPVAVCSLASFSSWSPRTTATTGRSSAT